ncbi:MAG: hypothetical protein PVH77_09315 [Phycisphaerales bacterium]|jgi:hypothetical protein
MFTLIKREVMDHLVYFIGAAIFSAILIAIMLSTVRHSDSKDPHILPIGFGVPLAMLIVIGLCGMGASQMYTDKTRKTSAFLSTLSVSRSRILLARIITGTLAILTFLLPLTVSIVFLTRLFPPPIPIYQGMVFEIFTAVFLMGFACYCIGLQTGWNSSKIIPTLGGLILTCIFIPLILIKGFGLHVIVILVLFIAASLIRIWHTFTSTPL